MTRALSILLLSASLAIAAPKDRTLIEAADPEIDPFGHSLPTLIRVPVKNKAEETAVTNKVTGWMKKKAEIEMKRLSAILAMIAALAFAQDYRDAIYIEITEQVDDMETEPAQVRIETDDLAAWTAARAEWEPYFAGLKYTVSAHYHQHGPPGSTAPCRLTLVATDAGQVIPDAEVFQ